MEALLTKLMRLFPERAYRKSLLRARLSPENGQTLVEFAISLGIFLAVTIGIIILCLALFTYEYVDFAAREASRWAAVRGSDCYLSTQSMPGCSSLSGASPTDIQNYVQNLNFPLIDPAKLANNVNVSWLSLTYATNSTTGNVYATWTACDPTNPPTGTVCNQPGNAVKVSVSYPFNLGISIPFVGSFTPTVTGISQTVISQ